MTPEQTTMLLTYMAGLDPRTAPKDNRDAQMRIAAWTDVLAPYTYDDCKAAVKRYYSTDQQWPMQIGQIVALCKPADRWEERIALTSAVGKPMPDEVKALLKRDSPDHRARKVPCPWASCKAQPFQPCTSEGKPLQGGKVHPSRVDHARAAA